MLGMLSMQRPASGKVTASPSSGVSDGLDGPPGAFAQPAGLAIGSCLARAFRLARVGPALPGFLDVDGRPCRPRSAGPRALRRPRGRRTAEMLVAVTLVLGAGVATTEFAGDFLLRARWSAPASAFDQQVENLRPPAAVKLNRGQLVVERRALPVSGEAGVDSPQRVSGRRPRLPVPPGAERGHRLVRDRLPARRQHL